MIQFIPLRKQASTLVIVATLLFLSGLNGLAQSYGNRPNYGKAL